MTAKSHRTSPDTGRPFWQHPLLLPGVLVVLAILAFLSSDGTFAFAFVLGALGTALYTLGKANRWKGAPEAGLLVAGIGALTAIWALVG